MGYFILPDYPSRSEVEFLSGVGMGGGGVIVSNPTAVKVELSCIEVVVGVLTIDVYDCLV